MPWFSFTSDFDYRPTRRVMLAYKAGTTQMIPTAAAEAAESAGAGKRVQKPKADDAGA
ncbi:hypothetical protein [Inquilinus sp.]|uniref:hypothetical protein n=1 Tax=Inquilinus sp. TaxID=1932117 RepID=UPI0031E1B958